MRSIFSCKDHVHFFFPLNDIVNTPCLSLYLFYLLLHNLRPFTISFVLLFLIFIYLHVSQLCLPFYGFTPVIPLWQISFSFQFLSLQGHVLLVVLNTLTSPERLLIARMRARVRRRWRVRWRAKKGLDFNQPQAVIWGLRTQPVNQPRNFHIFFFSWTIEMTLICFPGPSYILIVLILNCCQSYCCKTARQLCFACFYITNLSKMLALD